MPFVNNSAGVTSYLPSFDTNYRIRENWSIYAQIATGSIIPPSSVFDVTGGKVIGLPKPSSAITYQGGSVAKFRRMTLNGDLYYVHYGNAYSASADPNNPIYTSQGDSVTKGFEGEGNFYLYRGLSFYANGTVGSARYVSQTVGGQPNPNNNLWVAFTPSNTQTWGLTYQQKYLDFGILNKRVGPMWNDGTAVTASNAVIGTNANQVVPIDPFSVTNLFFNYTVRSGSRFDQTKLRLSFNNLLDSHNITGVTPAIKGTTFVPNGNDVLQLLPGRSVMLSVVFAFNPKER